MRLLTQALSGIRHRSPAYLAAYTVVVVVACLWPFNFWQANMIRWDSSGGLQFASPSIAIVKGDISMIRDAREFTLLLHYASSAKGGSYRRGTILGYSLDAQRQNFVLEERLGGAIFRISSRGRRWPFELRFPYASQTTDRWIAVRYDGKSLGGLIDGRRIRDVSSGRLDFTAWDLSAPLVIGNEGDGKSPWKGEIDTVALLDRAGSFEDLQRPGDLIERSSPLLLVIFNGAGQVALSGRSRLQPVSVIVPRRFEPARRVVLQKLHLAFAELPDILINVIGFVPLGYFFALAFRPKFPRTASLLALTMIAGFLMSMAMELLQAYLPTRSSSMNDVLSNTVGMIPGFSLAKWTAALMERAERAPLSIASLTCWKLFP